MKIDCITIKNYKTFNDIGVSFKLLDITALVGENNSGKSNILEALDLFFNYSKTKIHREIFYNNDVTKEIQIVITFIKLDEKEINIFKSHLEDNKLVIKQTIKATTNNEEIDIREALDDQIEYIENKNGIKWKVKDEYEWLNLSEKLPTKKDITDWWKKELKLNDHNFKDLFDENVIPDQQKYKDKLENFWKLYENEIPLERIEGDENILGWKNKLKGNLPKYFYIPAIKNISDDLKITKTSPFGEIISWITMGISNEIKTEFNGKAKKLLTETIEKIDIDENGESRIDNINKILNENIGISVDCELRLKFGEPQINDIVFPEPKLFADDGYDSEISQKGHGLQRLSVFSLLRIYNTYDIKSKKKITNFIIAIEEPEIYLHPPIKRSTYELLRKISNDEGQVIYTTHDSYFISVEYFDEIRLFRKIRNDTINTEIYSFNYEELKEYYKKYYNKEIEIISLKHRFNHICDQSKNEGFFANKVILIEGQTEKYALPIYFKKLSFDIDKERIIIIQADSVDNITYLLPIFNDFHIPCYVIFDGDRPKKEYTELNGLELEDVKNKSRRNKEILKMLGVESDETEMVFPETTITDKYTIWKYNFEEEINKILDNYEELKGNAKKLYGTDSKPLTARFIATEVTEKYPEKIPEKMKIIIQAIKNCKWCKYIIKENPA